MEANLIFVFLLAFIVISLVWYLLEVIRCLISSGALGRRSILQAPIQSFWLNFLEHIPGGFERRVNKIKSLVGERDGIIIGYIRSWEYREIRKNDLYEEVARSVILSNNGYWSSQLLVFYIAWMGAFLTCSVTVMISRFIFDYVLLQSMGELVKICSLSLISHITTVFLLSFLSSKVDKFGP